MENYKGIYYKETKEQKYYEGGAHFPYKVLYNILLNLGGVIYNDEYINNGNNYNPDYLLIKKQNEKNIIKYKTRNIEQNKYMNMNNPNTLVKYSSQNIIFNQEKRKKSFISRNNNNFLYSDNDTNLNKGNYVTSINIHQTKKNNIDNHLLKMLLNRKEKEKHHEEKNKEEINNANRFSFMNYYKNVHYRNRSEFSNNTENNKKINNAERNGENTKNDFRTYIKNKIKLIKNYNNDKYSLEINGKNKDIRNEKQTINNYNNNNFISVHIQNSNIIPYLSYFKNLSKRTRNINNIIEYKNTFENNKNDLSTNYNKKNINHNIFQTSDNENINNNGLIFNNNKSKYFSNYTINNNKEIITKQKQNSLIFQKYKKKKINQICCFNINNTKSNSGKNIFAKNINTINIIHNKYINK